MLIGCSCPLSVLGEGGVCLLWVLCGVVVIFWFASASVGVIVVGCAVTGSGVGRLIPVLFVEVWVSVIDLLGFR